LKKFIIYLISASVLTGTYGCGFFQNKRETEIKERLQRIQEEVNRRADSIRNKERKLYNDSANKDIIRSLDSLKRSSDSLEKVIKKNIEELKRKNKPK